MFNACVYPLQAVPSGGVQRQTFGAVGHKDRDTAAGNGEELPYSYCIGTEKSIC